MLQQVTGIIGIWFSAKEESLSLGILNGARFGFFCISKAFPWIPLRAVSMADWGATLWIYTHIFYFTNRLLCCRNLYFSQEGTKMDAYIELFKISKNCIAHFSSYQEKRYNRG